MPDAAPEANPLLVPSSLPHQATPFDQIDVGHFLPAVEAGIERARARIETIKTNPAAPSFENTIIALESVSEDLDTALTVFYNLLSADTSDDLQALAAEIGPKQAAFGNDVTLDPVIFQRVKSVHDNTDRAGLTPEQLMLLQETYKGFTRNGALLNAADQASLRAIDEELSVLSPRFSENVLKATNAFEWVTQDVADLAGLPASALDAAQQAALEKGRAGSWLLSLQAPSVMPVLKYADNRALRETVWRAFSSRAFGDAHDNQQTLRRSAELRHNRAVLLGYASHADFVLEKRMAGSVETVTAFLDRLLRLAKPAAERELAALSAFAAEQGAPTPLQPWDVTYWSEKLRQKRFDFDEESLRPYFKLEAVIGGVFEHASRLFGLRFAQSDSYPVYHADVQVFEVHDDADRFIGLLYADFFPRASKRDGAWKTEYRGQGLWRGEVGRPHVSIVCNFTKSTPTKPSLLSFNEVQTLFHEFGHALHELLSQCTYRSLAGTNVLWDFVELPSQIFENWVLEKEGLDVFARHYETGAPIPPVLAQRIKDSANFMAGMATLRQVTFANLDMAWHSADPSAIASVEAFEEAAISPSRILPKIPATSISCAFGHIFAGGYAAGYYSYKWAEVLDADAFELFKERGLFDAETAQSFKSNILERGGTEPPMELYTRFRGRQPDPDALLRRDGLI